MSSKVLNRVVIVLAVLLVGAIGVYLLRGDEGVDLTQGEPQIVSVSDLEGFAEEAEHPVYWVGERADTEYELTEAARGRIFVRYLPEGTEAGTGQEEFLTIGTYPVDDAAGALRRTAGEGGRTELARSDDGALILIDPEAPRNVHLAHEDEEVQVEVFSPDAAEALRIASRDEIEPID